MKDRHPQEAALGAGDLPPHVVVPPPGPRSVQLTGRLAAVEPPEAAPAGIVWQAARGANVVDVDGNRYLDLTSGLGVASIGHRHPAVVAAVARQAGELLHGLADVHGHPLRVELGERLARLAPWRDARVFFAVSGSDAVEIALKTALLATGRSTVVAFEPSYHGVTLGSLQASSRPAFREPFASHFHGRVVRFPYGCDPRLVAETLSAGEAAAILVEPVVGREGVLLPPDGWLAALRRLASRHGALLVADEIYTGFGRTGEWFESVSRLDEPPDLICCGKALGGGLPIAAVLGDPTVLGAWSSAGEARHTATFVAHPLACAAALATLDVIESERLVVRARTLGGELGERLVAALSPFPWVTQVRGRGLVWAVELGDAALAADLSARALAAGLLLLAGGPDGRVVQVAPPLCVERAQLAVAVDLVTSAVASLGA